MNQTLINIAETAAKTALSLIPGLGAAGPLISEGIDLLDQLFGLGQSAVQAAKDGLTQGEVDAMVNTMDNLVEQVDKVLQGGAG